jgi:hypothetical protein
MMSFYFIRIFCYFITSYIFVLYYVIPFFFCYYFSSYPFVLFPVAFCTLSCSLFSYSFCLVLFIFRFVLEFLKYFGAFLFVSVFIPTSFLVQEQDRQRT